MGPGFRGTINVPLAKYSHIQFVMLITPRTQPFVFLVVVFVVVICKLTFIVAYTHDMVGEAHTLAKGIGWAGDLATAE